ncbi:MAG: hypothetical protein J6X44_05575 [Thermoguttaceae bacterium]|nr:hypothetical protein [Thermoguttaceae bacterium]
MNEESIEKFKTIYDEIYREHRVSLVRQKQSDLPPTSRLNEINPNETRNPYSIANLKFCEAVALSRFFEFELGSEENKAVSKRVLLTNRRLDELFPEYEIERTTPQIEQSDYVYFDEKDHELKAYGNNDELAAKDEFSTQFSTYVRLIPKKENDGKTIQQALNVSVYYYPTEKEARINLFTIPCANNIGARQMVVSNRIRSGAKLSIGEACLVKPDVNVKDKEVIDSICFVRDCTVFIVQTRFDSSVSSSDLISQSSSFVNLTKRLDDYYIKANKDLNRAPKDE